MSSSPVPPVGRLLKHWRRQRKVSQLDLALAAGISARHLGFVEVGRSRPGREVVLALGRALDLPLVERNQLLTAAGWPPAYDEVELTAPARQGLRDMLRLLLDKQDPFPAFVLDGSWRLVDANASARRLFPELDTLEPEALLETLYVGGRLREMVVNWEEVAWASVDRLRRDAAAAGFPDVLTRLVRVAEAAVEGVPRPDPSAAMSPVACPILRIGDRQVRTMTAVASFGTALDAQLEQLRIELVYPADDHAKAFFEALAQAAA